MASFSRTRTIFFPSTLCFVLLLAPSPSYFASGAASRVRQRKSLADLPYASPPYPRRLTEQAAVIEWGNSAVISALDAVSSAPAFGVHASDGAFFEVEATPVIGRPNDGSSPLENADEVEGNMLVLTNGGGKSAVKMATMAQAAGAAALMVVNILDGEGGDAVAALKVLKGEEAAAAKVEIPVVSVSLASGNELTSASQPEEGRDGLPERIRLYAAGDRPFFEDVSGDGPVAYLIHDVLTEEECDGLIADASAVGLKSYDGKPNWLEGTDGAKEGTWKNLERTYLWKGLFKNLRYKTMEERIEQVTGFTADQTSDFQVDKFSESGHFSPRYDHVLNAGREQVATMIIFLNDPPDGSDGGGEIVLPSADPPLKIRPKRGMALVVHGALDDTKRWEVDSQSIRADMPVSGEGWEKWTATKYFRTGPDPLVRRIVLPALSAPTGGRLPGFVAVAFDVLVKRLGWERGVRAFDFLLMVVPVLLFLLLASVLQGYVMGTVGGDGKVSVTMPAAVHKKVAKTKITAEKRSVAKAKPKKKKNTKGD